MVEILRTNSENLDFIELVKHLDADLASKDGSDHAFYSQFNKIDSIKFVLVAYLNDQPMGCGAIKKFDETTVEIKRMYVHPEARGKGIATKVLHELEKWAAELSIEKCLLETGKNQVEALGLYQKNGYQQVENYGQYTGVATSFCFQKVLNQPHASVAQMWDAFTSENESYKGNPVPESFYFCDNKKDADECADLVAKGIKQATAGSKRSYEKYNEPLPKVDDVFIVTNWEGKAVAVIKTTKIEHVPFHQISADFAYTEGEGDKSLAYWKKVHWDFFTREMKAYNEEPTEGMIIVCEYFKTIWTNI
jgi:putative acetyltransferase